MKLLLCIFIIFFASNVFAQTAVFVGKPETKIELGNLNMLTENEKSDYRVLITEDNGKFYWASRQNKELSRYEAGAIISYTALDGSGSIIIASDKMMTQCWDADKKDLVVYLALMLPPKDKEAIEHADAYGCYNYSENIRTGIAYISYFGKGE